MSEKKKKLILFGTVYLLANLLSFTLGAFIFLRFNQINDIPLPWTLWMYWSDGLAFSYSLAYKIGLITAILLPFIVTLFFFIVLSRKPKRELHGSARFANLAEVTKAGLFKEDKEEILIGQYKGKYLRWSGKQFGFLAAPTRSGKGVGIVIPNCLNYKGSLIVFDPKLENFKLTSGYRATALDQEVYLLNPSSRGDDKFGKDKQVEGYFSHCWNPLSYVSRNRLRTVGDALNIANILYNASEDSGGGNAKFFAEMAQKLFLGLVLYMIEDEKRYRTQLKEELEATENLEKEELEKEIEKRVKENDITPTMAKLLALTTPKGGFKNLADWIKKVVVPNDYYSDTCKNNLLSYAGTSEQTAASILSSLIAPLGVFNDEIVKEVTSRDDFDLRDIRKRKMTIYIGIKPNDIAKFSRLINLFFSQLISVNTEELPEDDPENLKYQVLLLIDEFAAIGKVEIIEKSVAYIAGYNLRLFPIFQNMSQLNSLYTKDGARSLSTNFECHIIYPPRDNEDAKEYSEIIGYETFKAVGTSKNRGQMVSGSESISDQRRAVMNPDELRTMPTTDCIISMTGIPPIRAKKILYYKDPFFNTKVSFETPPIPNLGINAEDKLPNVDFNAASKEAENQELQSADNLLGIDISDEHKEMAIETIIYIDSFFKDKNGHYPIPKTELKRLCAKNLQSKITISKLLEVDNELMKVGYTQEKISSN